MPEITLEGPYPNESYMGVDIAYTCKVNMGTIVWSLNDVQVNTQEQSEYYERFNLYVPAPEEGKSVSRATIRMFRGEDLVLQCHLDIGAPRFIIASSAKKIVERSKGQ